MVSINLVYSYLFLSFDIDQTNEALVINNFKRKFHTVFGLFYINFS